MHDTALRIGCLAIDIYAGSGNNEILEIGAKNVNGSLRSHAGSATTYVGIDFEPGLDVDIVVTPDAPLPVADGRFDLVIASSVLEHDPSFWSTFLQMCRKARPGGFIYINTPSNGEVHRYPSDNWRFYPDSGRALAQWAVSQDVAVDLVESFVAERDQDIWNDFVAVFRRSGGSTPLPASLLHEQVPSVNVCIGNSTDFLRPQAKTQDMLLLHNARAQLTDSMAEKDAWIFQLSKERAASDKAARSAYAAQQRAERQLNQALDRIDYLERSSAQTKVRSEKALIEAKDQFEQALGDLTSRAEQAATLLDRERNIAERRLAERFAESAMLIRFLGEQEDLRARDGARAEWLRRISAELVACPWWWSLLPPSIRQRRIDHRLVRRGLFNGAAYLAQYPDVAAAGMDPLKHYILHGIIEGRRGPDQITLSS